MSSHWRPFPSAERELELRPEKEPSACNGTLPAVRRLLPPTAAVAVDSEGESRGGRRSPTSRTRGCSDRGFFVPTVRPASALFHILSFHRPATFYATLIAKHRFYKECLTAVLPLSASRDLMTCSVLRPRLRPRFGPTGGGGGGRGGGVHPLCKPRAI